jgi:hypothetical protein
MATENGPRVLGPRRRKRSDLPPEIGLGDELKFILWE